MTRNRLDHLRREMIAVSRTMEAIGRHAQRYPYKRQKDYRSALNTVLSYLAGRRLELADQIQERQPAL